MLLALALASCIPPYVPPTADQPHATLKVRRVYERPSGERLDEVCLVNGHHALKQRSAIAMTQAPRTDAFLAYPKPSEVEVRARFFHNEMRSVTETYSVQEPYIATESYPCGTGTSYRSCTRTVTRYRSVMKTRTVMKNVEVTDGACKRSVYLAPAVDHAYLIDFTYHDNGACAAICLEQTPGLDGSFTNQACPPLTPSQIAELAAESEACVDTQGPPVESLGLRPSREKDEELREAVSGDARRANAPRGWLPQA